MSTWHVVVFGVEVAADGSDLDDLLIAEEVLKRAEREVRVAVKKFQTLQLGSVLEAKVIAELAAGGRSVAELTAEIFTTHRERPDYSACYDRIRRALRVLEGRGYVTRRLFGKERPYRLTKLAMANLLRLHPGTSSKNWTDWAAFSGLATLAAVTVALSPNAAARRLFFVSYSTFLVLGGVCLVRMIQMVREVT